MKTTAEGLVDLTNSFSSNEPASATLFRLYALGDSTPDSAPRAEHLRDFGQTLTDLGQRLIKASERFDQ